MICRLPGRCSGQELELQFLGFRDSGTMTTRRGSQRRALAEWRTMETGMEQHDTRVSNLQSVDKGLYYIVAVAKPKLKATHSHTERPLVSGELVLSTWIWMRGVQRPKVELLLCLCLNVLHFTVKCGPDRVDICQRCNCPWDPLLVFLCPSPLFDSASHVENFNLSM